MKWNTIVGMGAVLGALGVAIGAFGAHSLKQSLSPYALNVFETGNKYHMYHSFAIVIVGALAGQIKARFLSLSACFFLAGILIFSGSLYALAVTGVKWLGAVTPIGGVAFLIAWGTLALGMFRNSRND